MEYRSVVDKEELWLNRRRCEVSEVINIVSNRGMSFLIESQEAAAGGVVQLGRIWPHHVQADVHQKGYLPKVITTSRSRVANVLLYSTKVEDTADAEQQDAPPHQKCYKITLREPLPSLR